jgi:hypothetical protein
MGLALYCVLARSLVVSAALDSPAGLAVVVDASMVRRLVGKPPGWCWTLPRRLLLEWPRKNGDIVI